MDQVGVNALQSQAPTGGRVPKKPGDMPHESEELTLAAALLRDLDKP